MHLLYLTELTLLEKIKVNNSAWLSSMLPITGDIAIAFELERLGVCFIDEWDFLEPHEINHNKAKAHYLAKNWWHKFHDNTKYEELSLVAAAHQDLVYPFEACLNAATVYNKIFNKYSIESISGYFLPSTPVIRTGPLPTRKSVHSVSQSILFYVAEARRIHINYLDENLVQRNSIK